MVTLQDDLFTRYDPHLSPCWRWRWAQDLARRKAGAKGALDDRWVSMATAFLDDHKPIWDAQIAAAVELANGPILVRLSVEARVLAAMDATDISQRTGLAQAAVEAFEKLFFDCRPYLRAESWVRNRAVQSEGPIGALPTVRAAVLSMAYHGGQTVVEDVLAALARYPSESGWSTLTSGDQLTDLDRKILRTIGVLITPQTFENAQVLQKEFLRMRQVEAMRRQGWSQAAPLNRREENGFWTAVRPTLEAALDALRQPLQAVA